MSTQNHTGRMIIGNSRTFSDLFYATGFSASDIIYFSVNDTGYIAVSALEFERAKNETLPGITVLDRNDLCPGEQPKDTKSVLKAIIEKYPCGKWLVPSYFPFFYAEFLNLSGAEITCVEAEFFPQRRKKTDDEKEKIRDGVSVAVRAMNKAEAVLRESSVSRKGELLYNGEILTSEYLKLVINLEIVSCGGYATGTIASSGRQTALPHDTGSGAVMANVPIILDIFPRIEKTGYCGDLTRTFVKGKASEIVKKAYQAVYDSREMSKSSVRPGAVPDTVHRAVLELFENRGFKTGKEKGSYYGFFHGLGHGLGLDVHELPRFSINQKLPLEEGDVITVEPGLYYPEWGGVRLEDVVAVASSGCECLTDCMDILEIP